MGAHVVYPALQDGHLVFKDFEADVIDAVLSLLVEAYVSYIVLQLEVRRHDGGHDAGSTDYCNDEIPDGDTFEFPMFDGSHAIADEFERNNWRSSLRRSTSVLQATFSPVFGSVILFQTRNWSAAPA